MALCGLATAIGNKEVGEPCGRKEQVKVLRLCILCVACALLCLCHSSESSWLPAVILQVGKLRS